VNGSAADDALDNMIVTGFALGAFVPLVLLWMYVSLTTHEQ
jgi:hypothetical protein